MNISDCRFLKSDLCYLLPRHYIPMDYIITLQAPLSMGFPRQEYWIGLPFPSLRDLPSPGIESASPALAGRFFTAEPPGKPINLLPKKNQPFPSASSTSCTA